jgi:hypothetical protein
MAYRNKVYFCMDYDNDGFAYNRIKGWNAHKNIDFKFLNVHELNTIRPWSNEDTIKRNLRERLKNTKIMLVLVGEKTKYHHKYVRWEMELALSMDIPIVAVNLNGKNRIDYNLCPPILRGKRVVHIPYSKEAINFMLDNWYNAYHNPKFKDYTDLYYDM